MTHHHRHPRPTLLPITPYNINHDVINLPVINYSLVFIYNGLSRRFIRRFTILAQCPDRMWVSVTGCKPRVSIVAVCPVGIVVKRSRVWSCYDCVNGELTMDFTGFVCVFRFSISTVNCVLIVSYLV